MEYNFKKKQEIIQSLCEVERFLYATSKVWQIKDLKCVIESLMKK